MVSKYRKAIGKWEHTIGEITHVLEPQEDDNYNFLKVKSEAEATMKTDVLYKKTGELYLNMVLREDKAMSAEDQQDLKDWISLNINQIIKDWLIAFKWTTPEKLAKIEGDLKKKVGLST